MSSLPRDADTHGRWDPAQYLRFRDQRAQPFFDLAAMVQRVPGMRVLDLGCGTGELTTWLHGELGASTTIGIDRSDDMLRESAAHAEPGLHFELADITEFVGTSSGERFDLVFSNAALQWVDHHEELMPQLRRLLAAGGQLAVQVPWRSSHPVSEILTEVVSREPYASHLSGYRRASSTQTPDWYATRLHQLGASEQRVELRVYGHELASPLEAVEWLKGSALTPYRRRLTGELYEQMVAEYQQEVVNHCGADGPYYLPFNRILMWAQFRSLLAADEEGRSHD